MAEPFETLREVGVALDGFRSDVSGQFTTLKWIMGGVAVVGLAVAGVLFSKIDKLEDIAARNTAILERIETGLDKVATDTSAIRETVQTASVTPAPDSFDGYVGVKALEIDPDGAVAIHEVPASLSGGWIYYPMNGGIDENDIMPVENTSE